MKLVYPACFYLEENGEYSVTVPDLLGCNTQGNTIEEAMQMAQDAIAGWLFTASKENIEFPKPTDIKKIQLINENGFTSLLLLDLDAYFKEYGEKEIVEKTVTIPSWLNEKAEKHLINLSQTLQDAILYKIMHSL